MEFLCFAIAVTIHEVQQEMEAKNGRMVETEQEGMTLSDMKANINKTFDLIVQMLQQDDGYKETEGRNRETVDTGETNLSTGSKRSDH